MHTHILRRLRRQGVEGVSRRGRGSLQGYPGLSPGIYCRTCHPFLSGYHMNGTYWIPGWVQQLPEQNIRVAAGVGECMQVPARQVPGPVKPPGYPELSPGIYCRTCHQLVPGFRTHGREGRNLRAQEKRGHTRAAEVAEFPAQGMLKRYSLQGARDHHRNHRISYLGSRVFRTTGIEAGVPASQRPLPAPAGVPGPEQPAQQEWGSHRSSHRRSRRISRPVQGESHTSDRAMVQQSPPPGQDQGAILPAGMPRSSGRISAKGLPFYHNPGRTT